MTKDEVLKLALDALYSVAGRGRKCDAAILAIKEVLAKPAIPLTDQWQILGGVDPVAVCAAGETTCQVSSPPPCSDHPDAPHGFDRSGSHCLGRYKCDCEGWVP